jgi:hypothetical protein
MDACRLGWELRLGTWRGCTWMSIARGKFVSTHHCPSDQVNVGPGMEDPYGPEFQFRPSTSAGATTRSGIDATPTARLTPVGPPRTATRSRRNRTSQPTGVSTKIGPSFRAGPERMRTFRFPAHRHQALARRHPLPRRRSRNPR